MKLPFESGDVRVTSLYGRRGGEYHKGIDLVGTSSTRIVAVEDAVVAVSTIVTDRQNKTWEWGNYVRLDLDDGRRLYHCHLSRRLVQAGERVRRGQVIGIMGDTGNAQGAHLHWELRPQGFSLESLDISEYSGIPNRIGVYARDGEELPPETVDVSFRTGERIRLREGAVYTNGVKVPERYLSGTYTVEQILPGRVLVRELYSWVENRYIFSAEEQEASSPNSEIRAGDAVEILSGASYTNGVRVPDRYVGRRFSVSQTLPGRVLVRELNSWVANEFVKKV